MYSVKQFANELPKGLYGCEGRNGECQEQNGRRHQADTQGCDIECWKRERLYFLQNRQATGEIASRDCIECYNPLDSGTASVRNSNLRHNSATQKIETAFDIIESIAEAFNNYDDESDNNESGIERKERQKIREKKEAQGMRMSR